MDFFSARKTNARLRLLARVRSYGSLKCSTPTSSETPGKIIALMPCTKFCETNTYS